MITNTINNRVVNQAIQQMTTFGVPKEVAQSAVLRVVKSLTSTAFEQLLNTRTPSEGIDRTNNGDE